MKLVGIAAHGYSETQNGQFFVSQIPASNGVLRTWRVELLPFLDSPQVRKRYVDEESWDSTLNSPVATELRNPYRCPAELEPADHQGRIKSAYLAVTGTRSFFFRQSTGPTVE